MEALTGAPAHILLNRKDDAASHSTRPAKKGGAGAFAAYSFGPLELADGKNKAGVDGAKKPVTGAGSIGTTRGSDIGWMTQLAASQHQK
jgi:hypothetical protein